MPSYVVHKSGSGYKVFKKGSSKSFSKKPITKAKAKAQQKALYASETNESLNTKQVGSNLEFKSAIPNIDKTEVAVVYKIKSERNANLTVVYNLGSNPEETDYSYFTIRDHNDPKGRPYKQTDPQSEEAKKLLSVYDLESNDIEMAGQDGYDKIAEIVFSHEKLNEPYEESFEFEGLYKKLMTSNEKK